MLGIPGVVRDQVWYERPPFYIFIGFAIFYRRFIKGFSRIAAPVIAMLKTIGSFVASASSIDDNEIIGGRGAVSWSDTSRKLAKSKSWTKSGNNSEEPKFLTSEAKEAFNCLRQVFTKALILRHFDPECHIQIKTDVLGYVIGGVLSRLTPNQVILEEAIGSNIN